MSILKLPNQFTISKINYPNTNIKKLTDLNGLTLILGQAKTGKTILSKYLINKLSDPYNSIIVFNQESLTRDFLRGLDWKNPRLNIYFGSEMDNIIDSITLHKRTYGKILVTIESIDLLDTTRSEALMRLRRLIDDNCVIFIFGHNINHYSGDNNVDNFVRNFHIDLRPVDNVISLSRGLSENFCRFELLKSRLFEQYSFKYKLDYPSNIIEL